MSHVLFQNASFIHIRPTPNLVEALKNRRISFITKDPKVFTYVQMSKSARIEPYCDFPESYELITTGSFTYRNSSSNVETGRYCSIAGAVYVLGARHPIEHATTAGLSYGVAQPMQKRAWAELLDDGRKPILDSVPRYGAAPIVEHDVWIAQNVMLTRGITIGTGAVVASGAVVTKDVPPYAVVGGVPAQTIKMRFKDSLIERFLASRWWEVHPRYVVTDALRDPERFLDNIAGAAEKWSPEPLTWSLLLQDLGETEPPPRSP